MKAKGFDQFAEKSLVIIKPDGVQRGLVGEIITRFEKKGLKIVAMKMVWPTEEMARKHYDQPEHAARALGEKTIAAYKEKGIDLNKDPMDIAKDIQKKLVRYLTGGPVVVMVIEGAHAIAHVRKIRGGTNPLSADVGSITADLTVDSYFIADADERAVRNLVHASGSVEEANVELAIWFSKQEIHKYNLAVDEILYSREWEDTFRALVKGK
jgi:nucleoside-diphosphate kinase